LSDSSHSEDAQSAMVHVVTDQQIDGPLAPLSVVHEGSGVYCERHRQILGESNTSKDCFSSAQASP